MMLVTGSVPGEFGGTRLVDVIGAGFNKHQERV